MNSLIRKLFNGRLTPGNEINPKDPEYLKLRAAIDEKMRHLESIIPKESLSYILELEELNNHASSIYNAEVFENGFRLGATLIMEALYKKENS